MKVTVKATYVKPTVRRISLMSNALSGMALACCRAAVIVTSAN